MLKKGIYIVVLMFLASCVAQKQVDMNKSGFGLQKSSFEDLQGWDSDDFFEVDKALKGVCRTIINSQRNELKSDKMSIPLHAYKTHCKFMLGLKGSSLKEYVQNNFEPYAVYYQNERKGKFTSYYEASIRASYEKTGVYKYPIYGKPKDLIEVNLKDFDSQLPNQRLVGRVKNGKLIKYYTRKEIEEGKLDAPVILWGDNPIDIFIMQIQGSAVATLSNGTNVRVGYADNNGHNFRGIGSILLEKGLIKKNEASMPQIKTWLEKNETLAKDNMALNDRYIFHKIVKADGPLGAMGIPLVGGRSMAVDRAYIPLGVMMWLETKSPDNKAINKVVIAEDVGSAIKGGVRGDYFWGYGEEAFYWAGKMNSIGQYYMLLPKDIEVKVYD